MKVLNAMANDGANVFIPVENISRFELKFELNGNDEKVEKLQGNYIVNLIDKQGNSYFYTKVTNISEFEEKIKLI